MSKDMPDQRQKGTAKATESVILNRLVEYVIDSRISELNSLAII